MNTIIFILSCLDTFLCSISSGYLYSDTMKSFISKSESRSRPVLFTVRSGGVAKMEKHKDLKLKVLAIDNEASSGFTIDLNSKGEVKLIKKGLCETVHKKKLKLAKCKDKNSKQRFLWVPEAMFSIFVDRIKQNPSAEIKRKPATSSDVESTNALKYERLHEAFKNRRKDINNDSSCEETSTGCNSNILGALDGLANPKERLSGDVTPLKDKSLTQNSATTNSSQVQDNSLQFYVDKFLSEYSKKLFPGIQNKMKGSGTVTSRKCKPNDLNCDYFTSFLKNSMPSALNIELLDKSFVKDLNEIMTENRIPIYHQGSSNSRNKGNTRESQVFFDSSCKCRYECVKNPQNNGCFYKLNLDGTLEPILKNKNCCKDRKSNMCDLKTDFDSKICKSFLSNGYLDINRQIDGLVKSN